MIILDNSRKKGGRKGCKAKKITDNEVVAAIPEEKVFLKTIHLPKIPLSKIDSTIAWQIESLMPYKIEEVYYNWKIIGDADNQLVILLAVCEKTIIDSLFETLILAELKPLIITFPSIGLANLLARGNNTIVIVDLSRQNSISLIIAQNGNVHFSTSRHIDSDYRGLEQIVSSTINYYHQKYLQNNIKSILVFGLPELVRIEDRLKQNISNVTRIGKKEDIKVINNIKEEYLSYIDNLGLDLSLEKLSLMPPELRDNFKNEQTNYRFSSILNYFILFIIFIALVYLIYFVKINYDLLNVSKEYANLLQNQTSTKQKELESEIQSFNAKLDIIKSLSLDKSLKPIIIKQIISAKDENITLKSIVIDQNKNVKITGLAKNRNDLILYKDKLNSLNIMAEINLPIAALEKKDDINFELTSTLK